jgi:hypothetical protein
MGTPWELAVASVERQPGPRPSLIRSEFSRLDAISSTAPLSFLRGRRRLNQQSRRLSFCGLTEGEWKGLERVWYWWACFPGCLADSEPNGPFSSVELCPQLRTYRCIAVNRRFGPTGTERICSKIASLLNHLIGGSE